MTEERSVTQEQDINCQDTPGDDTGDTQVSARQSRPKERTKRMPIIKRVL